MEWALSPGSTTGRNLPGPLGRPSSSPRRDSLTVNITTHLGHLLAADGPERRLGRRLVARVLVERGTLFERRTVQVQAHRLVRVTGVLHAVQPHRV